MQLALIGFPLSGVKTIYSALTGHAESAGAFSSAPGMTRRSVLKVPDERLDLLTSLFQPKKKVSATVELVEFPGLFGGKTVDPQAIAKAREADALVLVLRGFESDVAPHPAGSVDIHRDLQALMAEIVLADLPIIESRLERLVRNVRIKKDEAEAAELKVLERLKQTLEEGGSVREVELAADDRRRIQGFGFLSQKPLLLIANIGEARLGEEEEIVRPFQSRGFETQALCGVLEAELAQLEEEERREFMKDFGLEQLAAPRVLAAAYRVLETRTFFTYGEDECRAWNVRVGDTAVDAAGKIHSDLARGFIRAEVIGFEDFRAHPDIKEVKAAGRFRLEGREYVVQEGDLIIIRHSG